MKNPWESTTVTLQGRNPSPADIVAKFIELRRLISQLGLRSRSFDKEIVKTSRLLNIEVLEVLDLESAIIRILILLNKALPRTP